MAGVFHLWEKSVILKHITDKNVSFMSETAGFETDPEQWCFISGRNS